MLWSTQLRNTATQLISNALVGGGAIVASNKDTPAASGSMPQIVVYVDEKGRGDYGTAPQFETQATLTIELRVEAPSAQGAEALRDTLIETVKSALLGGQGFQVVCSVTAGESIVIPASLDNIAAGMKFMGQGVGPNNFIASINADGGSFALQWPYKGPSTGSFQFTIGSFIGLFEKIDSFQIFTDDGAVDKKNHVFGATIDIVGHTHEIFEPIAPQSLSGLNVYVDSINIFDPTGTYVTGTESGEEPFAGIAAPRTAGPDGRPEIGMPINLCED